MIIVNYFKHLMLVTLMISATSISATTSCTTPKKDMTEIGNMEAENGTNMEKFLGGLSPADALEYMKTTPNLLIIDVRENEWYEGFTQFVGNVHIPYSEMTKRYKELPTDRPVILNCGGGVVAPKAYKLLTELDVNVLSLCYIAGSPRFSEYNSWVKSQGKKAVK